MSESSPITTAEPGEQPSSLAPPPRPGFGFLLGGTTFGILCGLILLCAGATPPHVILIVLSICGAIAGGLLESLWPKSYRIQQSPPPKTRPRSTREQHECHQCGEVFEPTPVTCPMCGHQGKSHHSR